MLKCAKVFGDAMVLQREKPIRIWGTAGTGDHIQGTIRIGEHKEKSITAESAAASDGGWMLIFPEQELAWEAELEVKNLSAGEETIVFRDLCIGEVWIAGGQSNMEYPIYFDEDQEEVLQGEMNPYIRFFNYPQVSFEGMEDCYDYSQFGFWRRCTTEDLPYFSAAGFYFAEEVYRAAPVPIGILGCNWGGTPACAWMSEKYLNGTAGQIWIDEFQKENQDIDLDKNRKDFLADPMNDRSQPLKREEGLFGKVMYPGLTKEEQEYLADLSVSEDGGFVVQIGPHHPWRPCGLYESMLSHVAPYTSRGVIWYQGESDEKHAEIYAEVFGNMIQCWRDLWQDELPFLFVQLAPYELWLGNSGVNFPEVRRQQERVTQEVSSAWMISSSDSGMQWDIHPKKKKPIGTRLAWLAQKYIYGQDILADAPEFQKAELTDGRIVIQFLHGEGLHCSGECISALELLTAEGQEIQWESLEISDDRIIIFGEFPDSVELLFASTPYYEVNLYNRMLNPVKPFQAKIRKKAV